MCDNVHHIRKKLSGEVKMLAAHGASKRAITQPNVYTPLDVVCMCVVRQTLQQTD